VRRTFSNGVYVNWRGSEAFYAKYLEYSPDKPGIVTLKGFFLDWWPDPNSEQMRRIEKLGNLVIFVRRDLLTEEEWMTLLPEEILAYVWKNRIDWHRELLMSITPD